MSPRSIRRSTVKHASLAVEPTLPEYEAMIGAGMSEAAFQQQVVSALRARGWWVFTVPANVVKCYGCGNLIKRATNPGWPDVTATNGRRLIFLELKQGKTGRVSHEQSETHKLLRSAGQEVYVLKTTEWSRFLRIVEGRADGPRLEDEDGD